MASKTDLFRSPVVAVLAAVSSAALFYFGTGLHPLWELTWIATLPVLLVAPRLSGFSAFLIAFAACFGGELNMWNYLHDLLHIPLFVCLEILLLPALVFGLTVWLFGALLRRKAVWQAVISFPAAWAAYEYVSSALSPHSTFGSIAYSQVDFPPVLQFASIAGIWGISFSLFLLPAALAGVFGGPGTWRQKGSVAVAVCLFLGIVLGSGYWRLQDQAAPAASVTVGMVASDLQQNLLAEDPDDALRLLREYSEQASTLASRGAEIVVIPEKTAVLLNSYRDQVDTLFQSVATRTGATIVVGVIDVTADAKWNEARLYRPQTTAPTVYAKHHMLPIFESQLKPGVTRTEITQPSGRWGVMICKDLDFPLLSREYGRDGTALLLVPAWDFTVDGWLHGRMAILRGVESGFSIVRAAKQGILTISDDRGRVLAEQTTGSKDFATLIATVPVRHDATLYARFGDWFAWVCIGVVLFSLGLWLKQVL